MFKRSFSLFTLLLIFQFSFFAQPKIFLQNLSESSVIPYLDKPFFVIGNVSESINKLKVNDSEITLSENGSFLFYQKPKINFSEAENLKAPASYSFHLTNDELDTTIVFNFQVLLPIKSNTINDFSVDTNWMNQPRYDLSVRKGERVDIEIKSLSGCSVYFEVDGNDKKFPMAETDFIDSYYWGEAVFGGGLSSKGDTINGIYEGHFYVNRELNDSKITVLIEHENFGKLNYTLPGKVNSLPPDQSMLIETIPNPNYITARYAPAKGYRMFLEGGIKFEVSSIYGPWIGLKLTKDQQIFVHESDVKKLPAGSTVDHRSIQVIRTRELDNKIILDFGFTDRLPVEIIQISEPVGYKLLFYDVESNIDWVYFDTKIEEVKNIRHRQISDNILEVTIELDMKAHWGYSTNYDGSIFNFIINKPPKRKSGFLFSSNNLEGRKISLDPGHQPESGAIGPSGTKEKDVNFQITLKLKALLEDAGAIVFLTREKPEDPLPLRDRRSRVKSFDPELSISIHNNAVPQSVNPIIHNGASVYYYYPQSRALAKMIHNNFVENLDVPDFGFYWDNLYMCRITEAVSLLVEPAFMILPDQEKKLLTNEFQFKIAKSIFDAIENYYEEFAQ